MNGNQKFPKVTEIENGVVIQGAWQEEIVDGIRQLRDSLKGVG